MSHASVRNLVQCPHCGAQFAQHFPKDGTLGAKIIQFLQAQEYSVRLPDLLRQFPGYSKQRIRTCLYNLKSGKLVLNTKRGEWSA